MFEWLLLTIYEMSSVFRVVAKKYFKLEVKTSKLSLIL